MQSSHSMSRLHLYFLQVRHEDALGPVIGMADIIACNFFLPAN